jgi:phenylacetate-CoA ligase
MTPAAAYAEASRVALDRALRELPAYAPWRALDPGADMDIDSRYVAMPALTKADIRQACPHDFVPRLHDFAAGLASGTVALVATSGTTDERVTNIWNQAWWDASERASWQLNARTACLPLGDHREALLTSARSVGVLDDTRELAMDDRRDGRFLFLNEKSSPSLWTPELCARMLRELAQYQPLVLEANPSYLARLARYAATQRLPVWQPALIVLTFELPTHAARAAIRQVFTAPMVSSYGTTETGYVFMQCEHGCFHQNTAFCRVDVVPCAATQDDPLLGRMLVTPFHNPWCQYVRFDVGDIVRLRRDGRCPCGRDHGLIADAIEGRVKNLTTTCSGWAVTEAQVDAALAHCPGIFDYQLQQQAAGLYTLVLQCDSAAPPDVGAQAHAAMRGVYGAQAQIEVRCVAELEPSPSGKFRRVVPAADCSRDR